VAKMAKEKEENIWGNRLRLLRILTGLEQNHFAQVAGLSPGSYSQYEGRDRFPRNPLVKRAIAKALDISLDILEMGGQLTEPHFYSMLNHELRQHAQVYESFSDFFLEFVGADCTSVEIRLDKGSLVVYNEQIVVLMDIGMARAASELVPQHVKSDYSRLTQVNPLDITPDDLAILCKAGFIAPEALKPLSKRLLEIALLNQPIVVDWAGAVRDGLKEIEDFSLRRKVAKVLVSNLYPKLSRQLIDYAAETIAHPVVED